jgi:hypothetical protein
MAASPHPTPSRHATSPSGDGRAPEDPSSGIGDQALQALRRRRDALAKQVIELHWDLGGLAYEMAVRDHFRLDVLVSRAALLQERDAELAEVERLLRLEESASAGVCPACGAPHSRGALFCWQCGGTLLERGPSSAVPEAGSTEAARAVGAPGAGATDAQDTVVLAADPVAISGE